MTATNAPFPPRSSAPTFARSFVRLAFWPLFVAGVFALMIWADANGQHDPVRGVLARGREGGAGRG